MIVLLLTVALAGADPLKEALQSSDGLVKLFTEYEADQGNVYSVSETKFRLRIFRKNLRSIVETNEEHLGWQAGLNFFSDLTEEEGQQYLGLNMSLPHTPGTPLPLSTTPTAESIDWREKGAVTPVKSQGRCGSCWSFGAVGSVEGVHKAKSGNLVKFAEQELLDCVYEGKRDGCKGGWMHDCFAYMNREQRLAPSKAVRYRAKDGACKYGRVQNGLQRKVAGYYEVPKTEDGHLSGLARGPIAVAFHVTSKCKQYKKGIFKDTSCSRYANHAVTMVSYDSEKFAIKNSWGGSWGDHGYIYMARNHHNCNMYLHSSIITLSDEAPEPRPTDEPEPTPEPTEPQPDPECVDEWGQSCVTHAAHLCSQNAYRILCKK